ncbi:MAG: hypothetical protein PHE79_04925 [Eubacteriales bacterium]|nr:hypothetical protein [Eubacteriales bacterium]
MKRHINFKDIPDKAEVKVIYADGSVGNHGIVKGADLHYLLRGCTFDQEFNLWFSDKHKNFAYKVVAI